MILERHTGGECNGRLNNLDGTEVNLAWNSHGMQPLDGVMRNDKPEGILRVTDGKVLVAEDDPQLLEFLEGVKGSLDYHLDIAKSYVSAIENLVKKKHGLYVFDYQFPRNEGCKDPEELGIRLGLRAKELYSDARVIITTGQSTKQKDEEVRSYGFIPVAKGPQSILTIIKDGLAGKLQ